VADRFVFCYWFPCVSRCRSPASHYRQKSLLGSILPPNPDALKSRPSIFYEAVHAAVLAVYKIHQVHRAASTAHYQITGNYKTPPNNKTCRFHPSFINNLYLLNFLPKMIGIKPKAKCSRNQTNVLITTR